MTESPPESPPEPRRANGPAVEEVSPRTVPQTAVEAKVSEVPADASEEQAAYLRLPASTRQLLENELHAKVRGLRRIPTEKLR